MFAALKAATRRLMPAGRCVFTSYNARHRDPQGKRVALVRRSTSGYAEDPQTRSKGTGAPEGTTSQRASP